MRLFRNRDLLIATMHGKERVLAPILQEELGVNCFTPTDLDTDVFGTFSGEVERKDPAVITLKNKCLKAMEMSGCDLGIASEGSFGPHPAIPFIPANEEFIILIDLQNGLEIMGRKFSVETNFARERVENWEELVTFANRALFPSHGLILRDPNNKMNLFKGISDWDLLKTTFQKIYKDSSSVLVETDMRALYNPSRMEMIKKAGENLLNNLRSCCPECQSPGFSVSLATPGLPCQLCSLPTKSVQSYTYECKKCAFKKEEKLPHGKSSEDPMYCDVCNP